MESVAFAKASCTLEDIGNTYGHDFTFSDEEPDFIINYDIKYRMGRETEGEEE